MQAIEKKYASFYRLTGRRIKPPMDKSWESSCSPVHREYKNISFISITKRISKLQTFVYVVVTKEFTDDSFSVNLPSFSNTEACRGQITIPWWMHKFMANTISEIQFRMPLYQ